MSSEMPWGPTKVPDDYAKTIIMATKHGCSSADVAKEIGLSVNLTRMYLYLLRRDGLVRLRSTKSGGFANRKYIWTAVRKRFVATERRIRSMDPEDIWKCLIKPGAYA